MNVPEPAAACPECAIRGALLAVLAGHIDVSVSGRAGGRARDLLALSDLDLAKAVAPSDPKGPLRRARERASDGSLPAELTRFGCWSACPHSGGLPASFEALDRARPRALYGVGDRALLAGLAAERSVTIVGSRRAGPYGREVAFELARMLASSGITVISGLALGIDSAAHEGALAGGGPTVAILGPGADRPYPRSRGNLYRQVRANGLVLSELPPNSPTFRWMFPARNRLMAAMAALTVVVEAAERSGSLITAEMAIEGGRQVGAVPGQVNSWRSGGANKLLAEGAAVIRDAQDVLDLLLGPGAEVASPAGPPTTAEERAVLTAVEGGAATADAIVAGCGLAVSSFSDALILLAGLERNGYVRTDAVGRYSRTSRAFPENAG